MIQEDTIQKSTEKDILISNFQQHRIQIIKKKIIDMKCAVYQGVQKREKYIVSQCVSNKTKLSRYNHKHALTLTCA